MLQVLLILLETRTSIALYTDMNTDIGANINIAKICTSLIQMESTSANVCIQIFILILVQALVSVTLSVLDSYIYAYQRSLNTALERSCSRFSEKLEHRTRTFVELPFAYKTFGSITS